MNEGLTIVKCYGQEMLDQVAQLADEIWNEYYPCILSEEQISYMVSSFQSGKAMDEQTRHQHYEYYQLIIDGQLVGYMGLQFQPDRLFLSKLYIKKAYRGQSLASSALEFAYELGRKQCYLSMFLRVNRNNAKALAFYQNKGFAIIEDEMTDIGQGYVMDDHVLELTL